ncbi:MAG: hypothetical protein RSD06_04245 [Bacilli bacterium]
MKIINKIIKKFKKTDEPNKIDYLLFGIISVLLFVCFLYSDIVITTEHTLNFMDVIKSGDFMDFYKVNYNLKINGLNTTVCYDILIYFIFMIWNIPLYIASRFMGINILKSFLCKLWLKGIVILFLYLTCKVMKKIFEELNIDKKLSKWGILIFASSPIIFSIVFMMCQYDIIPIFFVMLGILAYLKNEEKKFILYFMLAIPMKLFALFIFIPLLLLKEKRIFYIGTKTICSISVLLVCRILENFMPLYYESVQNFNGSMINRLSNIGFDISTGSVSIFMILYIIICIYCYSVKFKNKKHFQDLTIHIPFIVYAVLFTFFKVTHPQWYIYITPFITIMIIKNIKNFKLNFLLEMCMSVSLIYIHFVYFWWVFDTSSISLMLGKSPFKGNIVDSTNFLDLNTSFGLNKYMPIFYSIYFATILYLAILNFPKEESKQETVIIERSLIWSRMAIILPFALMLLLLYIL